MPRANLVSGFSRTVTVITEDGSAIVSPYRRTPMMDRMRRKLLKAGAAATMMAAAPRVFAQQSGQGRGSFYVKGPLRIHYQEFGSGFPLLLIAGGGLDSTISRLTNPFNA